jgi:hypothetical protein
LRFFVAVGLARVKWAAMGKAMHKLAHPRAAHAIVDRQQALVE